MPTENKEPAKKQAKNAEPQAPSGIELVEASDAFEKQYADDIHRRMKLGLSREQAIECAKAQVRNDAQLSKEQGAKS